MWLSAQSRTASRTGTSVSPSGVKAYSTVTGTVANAVRVTSRGLQAVKEFFGPVGPIDVEVHRVIADGDLVAVHSNYKTWNMAGVDIFRLNEEGKIIEHWDVLQPVPDTTASGNDLFTQAT
jgi:predicted SnoaL-like aldol condensation-catalyzing enzyme